MKTILFVLLAVLMAAGPAFAAYPAGSPCAAQPVTPTCPDRSFGWQERERGGLAPEAGSAGSSSGAGAGDGNGNGSSGEGDSGK
jgi:hypothetical protein